MSSADMGVAAAPLIDAHHGEDGGSRKKKFGGGAARYMECLKNHATAIGGSATDGCGEFLAGGEEGTIEALKCCACNCHRNYHRRIDVSLGVTAAAAEVLVRMEYDMEVRRSKAEEAAVNEAKLRKRFRTKFTQEQKEKMQQFAKKCGWKLTAGDAEVRSFCGEIGVEEKVLKVWMHNNKSTFADNTNTSNDNEYTNSPVAIY